MSEMENVLEEREEKLEEGSEDKHTKFYRISEKRVQKVANSIDVLGNCASSDYEYAQEDVEKMFAYLQKALDETKAKFVKVELPEFKWGKRKIEAFLFLSYS